MRLSAILGASLLLPLAAEAKAPLVATDIAPVHSLVAQVMKGVGEPSVLISGKASPHGYAMRPSDARAIQNADIVIWVGDALTPWLEGSLANLAKGQTLELLSVDGVEVLPWRAGADGEDAHEGHDHGNEDPHAWLDPEVGKQWMQAIADALIEIDPDNAETYRTNVVEGTARIDAAMTEATTRLAQRDNAPFIVYHDAYQYFETRFDLPPAISLALSDASSPPPARVEEIAHTIRASGASCIFAEPQFSEALISTVVDGTDTKTAILDPLGSDIPLGPGFYPSLILHIAASIAGCSTPG